MSPSQILVFIIFPSISIRLTAVCFWSGKIYTYSAKKKKLPKGISIMRKRRETQVPMMERKLPRFFNEVFFLLLCFSFGKLKSAFYCFSQVHELRAISSCSIYKRQFFSNLVETFFFFCYAIEMLKEVFCFVFFAIIFVVFYFSSSHSTAHRRHRRRCVD